MRLSGRYYLLAVLLAGIALAFDCPAQDAVSEGEAPRTEPAEETPSDVLNRGTPRRSALGFLEFGAESDFETAARFLDQRNLPPHIARIGGEELARQLYHVLSLTIWLDDYTLSDDPDGALGDELPGYRDELTVIEIAGRDYPIWLQRVPREDGSRIWKISNRSVALIPTLYKKLSYPKPVETIRQWFPQDASFLGLEAFKWFIVGVVAVIAWPTFWLAGWILSRLFSSPQNPAYPLVRKVFTGPYILIGTVLAIGWVLRRLGVGPQVQEFMEANTLLTIAVVWACWASVNLIRKHQSARLVSQDRPGAAKLLRPISTLVKLTILLIGLLYWLHNLGVNITAVLAGLGVGGLAIALALQKPIEDLMGAFSIFSQASVKVGDFCRYGDVVGTVEEIGLRTTRIRTLEHTLVTVPNSKIAYADVENYTARKKIRYCPTLRIRYDATPGQLRAIADGVLAMLEADKRVREDFLFVRFLKFEKDAILIRVHSYIRTASYLEFLEISEELNYRIVEIVQASGTGFALPGRSVYLQGEPSVQPGPESPAEPVIGS